jgi:hypothetical protein
MVGCFDNSANDTFANIDMPIGVGKANNRDDVLVVQALLFIVFTKGSFTALSDVPKGVTSFTITGTMEATRAALINAFKARKRKGGMMLTPGPFINPVHVFSRQARLQHHLTLVELNSDADMFLAANSQGPLIDVLRGWRPELANALSVGPVTTG